MVLSRSHLTLWRNDNVLLKHPTLGDMAEGSKNFRSQSKSLFFGHAVIERCRCQFRQFPHLSISSSTTTKETMIRLLKMQPSDSHCQECEVRSPPNISNRRDTIWRGWHAVIEFLCNDDDDLPRRKKIKVDRLDFWTISSRKGCDMSSRVRDKWASHFSRRRKWRWKSQKDDQGTTSLKQLWQPCLMR